MAVQRGRGRAVPSRAGETPNGTPNGATNGATSETPGDVPGEAPNDTPADSPADTPTDVADPGSAVRDRARVIPEAAVARLAVYLRVLSGLAEQGVGTISSEELSAASGVNSAKLRKDLSYIGSYGTRGVGYEVSVLIDEIERILGLTRKHAVAVVGIGNLGHALANYAGFPGRGFPVVALFDVDDDLMGVPVGGIPVDHIDDIATVCAERQVSIGVICTPATAAQPVCDRLVSAGVRCILNFAPVVLQVPDDVEVRKVDLAVEMQVLSFHVARRADGHGYTANGVNGAEVPGVDGMVIRR